MPFLEAGIPAVDLIDFTYGPGAPPGAYWHTPADTLDKVCPASLERVGETALIGRSRGSGDSPPKLALQVGARHTARRGLAFRVELHPLAAHFDGHRRCL